MSPKKAKHNEPKGVSPDSPQANRDDFSAASSLTPSAESRLPELRESGRKLLDGLTKGIDTDLYRRLHWQGSFEEYLALADRSPAVLRNAWQRLYDVITHYGVTRGPDGVPHYKIFDDPFNNGKDAIFGLDRHLNELVNTIRAGAEGFGPQNRLLLLHGPVGTAKSTIARILKNGVQHYSRLDEGALYTVGFKVTEGHPDYDPREPDKIRWCPNNEEPLRILDPSDRQRLVAQLTTDKGLRHDIVIKGECCPACRQEFRDLIKAANGNLAAVLENVFVKRLLLSESDRIGVGTFQPKDEKNQDSTELSGDINYRRIGICGSDSDPRAFNFDGEFNIANRGILEFVEVLKLDTAFLYDLLGATQEHRIKPKKFAQTDIDEVVIGHTNEPEYKKLVNDDKMEALRDRIIKIDIPYLTKLDHEERIYENLFRRVAGRIAPHTIHVAAMWAILTRLEEPNDQKLSIMQKLKIYNGEVVPSVSDPNATAERARELKTSAPKEGMSGVSPRYVIDTISIVLASAAGEVITPLQLLSGIHDKLKNNAMIKDEKVITRYRRLLDEVKRDYEDTIKAEVREAVIRTDEVGLRSLCENYLRSIARHIDILEQGPGATEGIPDSKLMALVEAKMSVHPSQAEDVRRTLVNTLRMREAQGKPFDVYENTQLRIALEDKLFEDRKDTLKLRPTDGMTDQGTEALLTYLGERFGYSRSSAQEIVSYVADIYARGESRKK